ncbi:hypothetical protein Tco_0975503 [Tanacetum coccineum]|uniref:Uncharacterized protein n=1 Tax=Tanacetum coccineum TaxID=301880 RepID=A0ABQ5EES0_9ASTR
MLQICPKLPDQQFEEVPFEEEILTFLRDLGHSGEIKSSTISSSNPLGMYHKKNVDYAYLLWEDFVYQVENKNVKRSNEMYYPRFTKVVSRHEDTQLYGAIFPDELTNEAIKDSESYKEYYAIASGAETPKRKASVKKKQTGSDKIKTPPTAKGKRLKTSAKAAKPAKKKQPTKMSKAKGITVLSEVALTEAEQMELATKRSLIQTHSSHASGSGINEGTSDKPGVPDVPTYASDDEQISWNSSDEEDDDEVAMSGDDDDDADNQDDDDNDDDDQNDDNTDNENDDDDGQDHEGQDDASRTNSRQLKRRDDEDKDEEPSAGSNWGSKEKRRSWKRTRVNQSTKGKDLPKQLESLLKGSKSHHKSCWQDLVKAEEPCIDCPKNLITRTSRVCNRRY